MILVQQITNLKTNILGLMISFTHQLFKCIFWGLCTHQRRSFLLPGTSVKLQMSHWGRLTWDNLFFQSGRDTEELDLLMINCSLIIHQNLWILIHVQLSNKHSYLTSIQFIPFPLCWKHLSQILALHFLLMV